jgi:hypothetical protein
MKPVPAPPRRLTRSELLFGELDGRYVELGPNNRAELRVFAVSRIALRWWIQFALRSGDTVRYGMIPVGPHDSAEHVLDRIAETSVFL